MRRIQKFGKKIDLPSTAQIVHELKLMMAADAVRVALAAAPETEQREQMLALEATLSGPDVTGGPSPHSSMELLRGAVARTG